MNTDRISWAMAVVVGMCCWGCASSQSSTNGTTYTRTPSGALVQVSEDEYHIHMPTSFPSGTETFHVTNTGSHAHNFKIEGNGVSQQLASDIAPGGTEDLSVTLTPGTYHVLCPLLGHADLGMRLDVTVTQR